MNKYGRKLLCLLLSVLLLCSLSACADDDRPMQGIGVATLCAVGDISYTDAMLKDARMVGGEYNFTKQLGDMAFTLSGADIAVGNIEGTFAGAPYSQEHTSYPDTLAQCLAGLGIDILQTANTCSIVNGISGLERTKSVIEDSGMVALGTYVDEANRAESQVYTREIDGIRFAFVSFTKGFGGMSLPAEKSHCVNLLYSDYTTNYDEIDYTTILSVLEAAQNANPDVLVAMLHWGSEGVSEISDSQKDIADYLVQNGVDVILGSHSHEVGPVERRNVTLENGTQKEAVIAYGLGDFCSVGDDGCTASLMLTLEFTRDHATQITSVSNVRYQTVAAIDRGEEADPRFTVLDGESAVELYENNYYDRISDETYARLISKREDIYAVLYPEQETAE